MPAGFFSVAADFHVAPAAGAVLTLVNEEPGTGNGAAFAYAVYIRRRQEFGGGVGDGPQRGLQFVSSRFGPASREASVARHDATVTQGLNQHLVDELKICRRGFLLRCNCGEHAINRLAQVAGLGQG